MDSLALTDRPAVVVSSTDVAVPVTRRPGRLRRRAANAPLTVFWVVIVTILVLPILLFLLVAVSPALLDQGTEVFSLAAFQKLLTGTFSVALTNTLMVGAITAVASTAVAFSVAWLVLRTDAPTRRLWSVAIFALLLAPSYLIALGWQRLVEPGGVLSVFGVDPTVARAVFYGPAGIILVLTVKGIPFAYLVIANALRGLGGEFEQAVRVHGGNRGASMRIVIALLAPAVWSAIAIVFAEAISDFGVASTLSSAAHFPVATFVLYNAIQAFPVQFPLAAAVGWVLLGLIVLALVLQSFALRGRSFRVLGGRTRPARRQQLTAPQKAAAAVFIVSLVIVTLGVPAFGAVSASLLDGLGSALAVHSWSLSNYSRVIADPGLRDPLIFSAQMAAITATIALLLAVVCARMLSSTRTNLSSKLLDFVLLAAVALPGIVFAAGYIFAFNLPFVNGMGIHLYGTTALLVLAYIATALPSTSRALVGNMSQLQESLSEACRVHGAGPVKTWVSVVMPVIAKPLLAAWLLTYAATLLELPVSQLLYPAGSAPVSVGINKALSTYDFGGGTAMEVLAILSALFVVGVVYGLFAVCAPRGWKKMGSART